MKIIIADDSKRCNAWFFIRTGWARALDLAGHEVYLWDIHNQPAMDLFDSLECDLFIGQSYNLERGIIKALSEHPETMVALQAGDWSKYSDSIDSSKYPILKASKSEIENVKKLQISRPVDLIFAHYHNNDIFKTHLRWHTELGITIMGMPPGLDVADYVGGKYYPEFECDIIHVSGYWPYKSQVINQFLLPLFNDDSLKIKVFGNSGWSGPKYCGNLDTKYVKHAFKSAKLNINICELHSLLPGNPEVNEKVFKLLGGKNKVLSTQDNSLFRNFFTNGEIEYAATPAEFQEKARAIVAGDLTIDPQRGYDKVMGKHTYFHRISDLFNFLSKDEESKNMLRVFDKIREVNEI